MPSPRNLSPRHVCLATAGLAVTLAITAAGPSAFAAQAPVGLGTATSFAVLAGSTVTNTGPTTISGDVGVSPESAVEGFPPGQITNGTIHAADAVASTAQDDLTTAYNDTAGRSPAVDQAGKDQTGKDLAGQTLEPGVYTASSEMALTGTVILDAKGDPNAVFVFKAGSTLTVNTSSTVALIGEAQACNVFWQVGSSATVFTSSTMVGTVMAQASITMQTNATLQGRLLARDGAVTLDSNVISRPSCLVASPSPSPSATPTTPSASATATPSSVATSGNPGGGESSDGGSAGGSGDDGGDGSDGGGSGTGIGEPVVPTGHPETGKDGVDDNHGSNLWLLAGFASILGAVGAAALGSRRRPSTQRT